MAVSTTTRKATFNMDGSTVAFDFTFSALTSSPTDIKCKWITVADNTAEDLTYTTDYTVSINSDGEGGTVTVSDAKSSAYQLFVYRETTNKQESDYSDFDQFPSDTLEQDLDRRTMVAQELKETLDRVVTYPLWYTNDQAFLPDPTANYLLGWDADGDQLINVDPDTLAPIVALKHTSLNVQTDDYTLTIDDDNRVVMLNSSGTITLTVPSSGTVAFVTGSTIGLLQVGAGQVVVTTASGVTINSKYGLKLSGQYAGATLLKTASDTWYLNGDTAS